MSKKEQKQRKYSPEFKISVIMDMQKKHLDLASSCHFAEIDCLRR